MKFYRIFLFDDFEIDGIWNDEAAQTVAQLTQFSMLQAQVAGYTESGIPEIYLYSYLDSNVSLVSTATLSQLYSNNSRSFVSFRFRILYSSIKS